MSEFQIINIHLYMLYKVEKLILVILIIVIFGSIIKKIEKFLNFFLFFLVKFFSFFHSSIEFINSSSFKNFLFTSVEWVRCRRSFYKYTRIFFSFKFISVSSFSSRKNF